MKRNIIQQKSYEFALKVIAVYRKNYTKEGEHALLNQLLRCGTSIGANIEEAEGAVSKKDFISKVSIAYKEARESQYWLRLLIDSGVIDRKSNGVLVDDCVELLKILNAIIKTSKTQEPVCSS